MIIGKNKIKKEGGWSPIPNNLHEMGLSPAAISLYVYMVTRPANFQFTQGRLVALMKDSAGMSERIIKRSLGELKKCGLSLPLVIKDPLTSHPLKWDRLVTMTPVAHNKERIELYMTPDSMREFYQSKDRLHDLNADEFEEEANSHNPLKDNDDGGRVRTHPVENPPSGSVPPLTRRNNNKKVSNKKRVRTSYSPSGTEPATSAEEFEETVSTPSEESLPRTSSPRRARRTSPTPTSAEDSMAKVRSAQGRRADKDAKKKPSTTKHIEKILDRLYRVIPAEFGDAAVVRSLTESNRYALKANVEATNKDVGFFLELVDFSANYWEPMIRHKFSWLKPLEVPKHLTPEFFARHLSRIMEFYTTVSASNGNIQPDPQRDMITKQTVELVDRKALNADRDKLQKEGDDILKGFMEQAINSDKQH